MAIFPTWIIATFVALILVCLTFVIRHGNFYRNIFLRVLDKNSDVQKKTDISSLPRYLLLRRNECLMRQVYECFMNATSRAVKTVNIEF